MATPHVAGLAALLMQAVPRATIDLVEQAIFASCTPLAGELTERQNRGVPDAVKALAALGGQQPGVAPAAAGRPAAPRPRKGRAARTPRLRKAKASRGH